MEEKETKEKEPKKNNKATLIIFAAIVFIVAGAVLILTGNNIKLLNGNDKDGTEEKDKPTDDPKRGTNQELTVEEAKKILDDKKASDFPDSEWTIDEVVSVLRGDNNTYLVTYKTTTDGNTDELQTIIFIENGVSNVELPGWHEGERDLTSYNFGNAATPDEPGEPPVEEPTEPPVEEPAEPPVEGPTEPAEPSVNEPVESPVEPSIDDSSNQITE